MMIEFSWSGLGPRQVRLCHVCLSSMSVEVPLSLVQLGADVRFRVLP